MSDLLDRVRQRLWSQPTVREVNMFGGVSFMVRDLMVVAVRKNESLLVRVDQDESEELQRRPGAAIATMGKDRSMGPGWLTVDAAQLTDEALDGWVEVALAYNERQSA